MEKTPCTFICECEQQAQAPANSFPEGWDVIDDKAVCRDCLNATVRLAPNMVSLNSGVFEGDAGATQMFAMADRTSIKLKQPPIVEPPFALCVAQQLPGEYAVALSPARVLTLYQPLAYLLDPDEADALADELRHYASLARRPGTLGAAA